MTTLLFACRGEDLEPWRSAFAAAMPALRVAPWAEIDDPEDVAYALAWSPPPGVLARCPRLEVVFSLGAGIEHVRTDPDFPMHVPLVRMVDPGLTTGMVEFVLWSVLHAHRRMPDYAAQQRAGVWRPLPQKLPEERRVGVLGLGALGGAAARVLVGLGFDVAGWAQSERRIEGVAVHAGREGLFALLARSEILVCLLPLTPATEGLLDAAALAALPRGASLINAGRGGQVVEGDLLAALDSGHIAHATLDVFRDEPLPPGHPFWRHPKVTVLPHVAAVTQPATAARTVAAAIARHRAGQPLANVVDWARGY